MLQQVSLQAPAPNLLLAVVELQSSSHAVTVISGLLIQLAVAVWAGEVKLISSIRVQAGPLWPLKAVRELQTLGGGDVHGISYGMYLYSIVDVLEYNCFNEIEFLFCLDLIKSDLSHCWSYFFFKADSVTKLKKLRNSLVI